MDTPLHRAVRNNDVDAAELLLIKGADLFTDNRSFESPTKMAMRTGNSQMFALLVKYGGRPEEVRRHKSRR
jgi:ankyrin repeat protein